MFNKTLKHSQFTNTTDYCSNLNTQINRTTKQTHYAKDHNNPKRIGKLEKKKKKVEITSGVWRRDGKSEILVVFEGQLNMVGGTGGSIIERSSDEMTGRNSVW